ncbi:MAG: hypothetical protein KBD24_00090 [Candidatus Pacebacteria bacterium]|nr:hypothetical protein [Candidatus Paceibacterota bacterium]
MYTIRAIPISRGTAVHELTYYSALAYPVGVILMVPVRSQEVPAVVLSTEEVRASKASLRTSDFALKKIRRQAPLGLISPEFVRAIQKTADHHAASAGAILYSHIPKALLAQDTIPLLPIAGPRPRLRGFIVPRLYQGLSDDRTEFYRTAVREAFAVKGSVFLVTPTITDAQRMHARLSVSIERYTYLLHSSLSQKEQKQQITDLLANQHPVLLICTAGYLSLPRHDLTTIIIEREGSSLYRARQRPFVDVRILAHHLTAELGGQLFLADLPLRIESVYRKEIGEYEEVVTGHQRMHFKTRARVISLKGEGREPKKPFYSIGRDLLVRMHETLEKNGRVFLYVARRGLSPITLCGDCGMTVGCRECGASVVLHKGKEENHFLCHACGAIRHARERCVNCQSWRLETLGIGTELVERELQERLPGKTVLTLSSDTARTHTSARRIADAFYGEPKSILVGTELALPYLAKHIPLVGVVSLDSLLSLASWNVYERITSTITRLRELAGEELLLQTRQPDNNVLAHALSGNFSGFYRSELKARKTMGYPPYTVLIKISVLGTEAEVCRRMEEARVALLPFELVTYSRLLRAPGGKLISHGFLRVTRDEWPHREILARLRTLPPCYTIVIDPDSIL